MGNFLVTLSGARSGILRQCPTERLKFQSLGWAILITAGMATVSMWFALTSVMGFNPVLAFPVAIMWGLIIMGIDRWLVTSMPIDGSRRLAIAAPRLVLAVLLGSLISTPIVLRVFQSEINAQISVMKEQRVSAFIGDQQRSTLAQQVTAYTKNVASLENVIASGGNATISSSDDATLQSLVQQRNADQVQEAKYYQQWQCQLYGPCLPKGNGPLARASQASYNQEAAQVALLNGKIQDRQNQLAQTNSASASTRLQQAKNALPQAQAQLTAAQAQQKALLDNFEATNTAANGLLIRLEALNQLSGSNFTLNSARLLLFLLFLVIECLPVTVKLLQPQGNYEKILRETAGRELKLATKAIRTQQPVSPGDDDRVVRDAALETIWPRTRVMDLPSWRSTADTDPYGEPPGEFGESRDRTRLDERLRAMRDVHTTPEYEARHGGIELRFGDDD
jgi:hypothetical protein